MARLSRNFYAEDTVSVAQRLLGKYLARVVDGETRLCRITETEAYVGRCDKACHAYPCRRTTRTEVLFGEPGHAYIYFIYGMHYCLNFVTEPEGEPAAVLIRGGEAVAGREAMWRARYGDQSANAYRQKNFLNGPGKLCQALSLTTAENRTDLVASDALFVCDSPADIGLPCPPPCRERICCGKRVGVDYAEEARDFPWRFWLEKEN